MKKYYMINNMQNVFFKLLFCTLLFSFLGKVTAQTTMLSHVIAEDPVNFANRDFEAGTLTVTISSLPSSSASVKITLPTGIEYVANSLQKSSGSATISHVSSSPINAPVFNISGAAPITFTIKRKVTKNALKGLLAAATVFKDKVVVNSGSAKDEKDSNTYALPIPNIVVQLAELTHNNASGTSIKTFKLRNTGTGAVKDIYFSVKYPTGITGLELTHNGTSVTSVGTVTGIGKNTGATLYKISNPNGFKLNDEITITEKYTVTGCQSNRQIVYEAYWGESPAILYQARDAGRAINVNTGTPNIVLDTDNNHTYFKWGDGICVNNLGTFTVQYINKGSGNATAYDLQMLITPYVSWKGFKSHKPTNFRIVATDGTEIPINSMTPNGNEVVEREIPFKDLTALSTTSALAGKDIGLKDMDGDGFKDDLPINAKLKVRFDMVQNQAMTCLQNDGGIFSVSPHSKFNYKDACGTFRTSAVHALTNYTFRRLITGIADTSKFPASLTQNEPIFGYLSVGSHTIIAQQKIQGEDTKNGTTKWKYEIKLPAGVELKNVKFYEGIGFGQSTKPATPLANVPAQGTLSYTSNVRGYITFDMLLTTPCTSGNVPLKYAIYYLDKVGDTNTYCELPLICADTEIGTICPGACAGNGPVMISTKAERADNSYGWTDYTMNTRQTRDNVSIIDRSRTLYLDDIEIISQGQQNGVQTNNLYYHAQVKTHADLIPKSIAISVGSSATVTLQAASAILDQGTNADGKYFRWNLSSALPTGGIAAGEKFIVVATYQVNNKNSRNSRDYVFDVQVGSKSFFYMLDNQNDTDINAFGYHTNEKHCGAKQTPAFYIAETYKIIGTNSYDIEACDITAIGSQQAYLARRFGTAGTYYTNEFRPSRRIKTLKITIPSSYNLVKPVDYSYIRAAGNWIDVDVQIPIDQFTITDDGTYKTYTYINPPKGSSGYLNPGTVSVENAYGETIRTWLQATCDSKTFVNTTQAIADNQLAKVDIDFEDFYYHYADKANIPVQGEHYEEWIKYSKKPAINLLTETPQNVTANQRTQTVDFNITNTSVSDAPYGWVSIPDVIGVKILSLVELDNSGSAVRTFTAQNISGEKMYFLSEGGNNGTIAKNTEKKYRLEYQITNCTNNLSFDVYAGWNCNGDPTQGYTKTCHDQKITYNVKIAKSLKQIRPSANNPGENNPDKIGTISMCQKTKYEYTINSGDEGDLFDTKLVVIQQPGLTISDVEVEYPLNSGNKYTQNSTPAINVSQVGNKVTYDITAILPNGTLPGSISQPSEVNKRNLRLSFNVQPDCEFTAGSSFDIDVEGNNLCGDPAEGDRTKVIIAGIAGVDTNKYKVNNSIVAQGGNANACSSSYAVFKGKHEIIDLSASHTFHTGDNGLVVIRIPKGFEYVTGSFNHTHNSATYFAAPTLATPPTKQIGNDETELSIRIPSGMKGNDYFEYTIQIRQKANTPIIDCGETKKIQYYTTDKVNGIACPSGPSNPCPSIAVETTTRRGEVEIPLERADLNIKNVVLTSVAESNKEKVTIQYAVENASTATMTYSGDLKVTLYGDTNNNGIIEETTDTKIQDFTVSGLSLAPGATTTRTETLLLDQGQLCRLYLSIRNTFNPCLCNDRAVKVNAPTAINGLVATVTACEIGKTEITYNSQAPEYESYTWEAVTPGALAHLSATDIKNPVFQYTGTNTTAIQTITYLLKVKRTNACEATQTVTVVVTPAPNAPTVAPQQFCAPATVLDLKLRVNSMATNSVKVYSGGTVLSDTTTLQSGIYKVSLVQPSGCETEKADVTVSVTVCNVVAKDDPYKVFAPITTATVTGNILNNDKVGGVTATTATVDITIISTAGTGTVPVVKSNGDVEVPANTPIGQYQITYKICAKGSSVDCATATVTVIVAPKLEAKDDDLGTLGGLAGGTTTKSVFDNDLKGTTPINPSDVNLTWGTPPSGITTNNDGTLTVAPNTPAGTYTVSYTICEKANPTNCSTATATVKVITLDAVNDGTKVLPKTGGNITVLNNDIYGAPTGVTSVTTVNVSLTITYNGGISGLTVNSDGTLNVPASTPAGTYNNVEYRICTLTTPVVCDTATLTIVKQPEIIANDDVFSGVVSTTNITVGNVLNNPPAGSDTLNGNQATTANVAIAVVTPAVGTVVPYLTPATGNVVIPTGTPTGTYTITYRICEKDQTGTPTTNCDTATVTVNVTSPIVTPTPTVHATPDTFTYSGTATQTVGNVLTNDTVSGTTSATTSNVTISQVSTPTGSVVPRIDTTNGNVIVPNNTPAGIYTITYQICTVATPTACATATVQVTVPAATPTPTVQANPDTFTYSGTATQTVGNVLTNDTVSGTTSATTSNVTISQVSTPTGTVVPRIDTTNGDVIVTNNTPAGIYTITYQICTVATPTACATATVQVTVPAATPTPTVHATPDEFTYSGTATQTVGNVLTNDTVSGTTSATTSNVTISQVSTPTGSVVPRIDTTNGNVIVPNNTPAGIYTITYQICTVATPTACATATVQVTVPAATPTPTVQATPDTFTYSGTATQTVGNVLTNDTVSGTTSATTSNVTISQVSTPTGAVVPRIDTTNGDVIVPNNTPAGIYTITYQICTVATPTACATATVQVTVPAATPTPTIAPIAVDDRATTPLNTPIVVNVLANDTLNGATTPNVVANPANGTVIVNLDGSIEYRPNTGFIGTDTFVYELCNPQGNCDSATVTIEVINTIIPYNGMSVDGDGKNDYFHIGGIESYPNNVVRIYNRWGVKVFETEGYDNVTRVFRGISNGRVTVNAPEKLPQGTYYYVIEYYDHNNNKESKVGWLYIKK
ncbi:gliding motility-associated C-terminal domain-containing protein [Capnocytophaga sputigena]|uniref:T9SS type B sorting domain-containing protein n=1 Tax=Capnocytophaga sputigena TaxID=1019 RepID=UPI0028E855C9|nr:gliding motility-associated C-terminal domain-containing protein [Capnocytophaga sputigena]